MARNGEEEKIFLKRKRKKKKEKKKRHREQVGMVIWGKNPCAWHVHPLRMATSLNGVALLCGVLAIDLRFPTSTPRRIVVQYQSNYLQDMQACVRSTNAI